VHSASSTQFASLPFSAGTKLFLLVDQFQELFRFRQDPDRARVADLAMAFVALLLEASVQPHGDGDIDRSSR
jgi:hypothetical protein